MAGRGRGRGRGGSNIPISIPGDQLLGPVLEPPPLYPTIDKKPHEIENTKDTDYLLLLNRELTDYYNEITEWIDSPEQLSDTPLIKPSFQWTHLPAELRPKAKARTIRIKPISNVGAELNRLEKLEKKVDKTDGEEGKEEDEINLEFEDVDEEMDDGTDYANDYFDNGEQYEDNDEGDAGPVY